MLLNLLVSLCCAVAGRIVPDGAVAYAAEDTAECATGNTAANTAGGTETYTTENTSPDAVTGHTPLADTLDVATVSSARNSAAEAVSPLQSLGQAHLERLGTARLHEAMNMFSGVSVKDYGGIGGLKTVSVRNMGAAHTAVIYDGIAISDAQNGQTDISGFCLDEIASVSLSIGLPEDIFCSSRHLAAAGVLKIESTDPSSEQINARVSAGSFGTYVPYLSVSRRLGEKYSLRAACNGTFSRGDYPFVLRNGQNESRLKRQNSDVESYGGEADFRADWGKKGRMGAKANVRYSERGLPGSVILYTQNATERLWERSLTGNIRYDLDIGEDWRFHADAGVSHSFNRHLDTDPVYPEAQESIYTQNEYSLAARLMWRPGARWKIVLADDVFINTLDSNIPDCPYPVRLSNSAALSAQYQGKTLKVTACLGSLSVTERLKNADAPADRFRIVPMVGMTWNVHRNLHLRASFKEGFRVPTFNDLYYARVGNTSLRPETARQSNIGLTFSGTYRWGNADFSADAYYNSVKDKIVAIPTMFIWKMRNFGKVAMYGTDISASAAWKICPGISLHLRGNWSWQYALDITDPESKNYRHQIPYTPRHCGNAGASVETPWVSISFRMNAAGKRYSLNQNIPANEIGAYADQSICISRTFRFGKHHSIYIGIEGLNLAGRNYEIIHYYPMPGRSFRITIKYKMTE